MYGIQIPGWVLVGSASSATQSEGSVDGDGKAKTYGIIGIILSQTDFMTRLDLLKHQRSIRIIIKIFF